MGSTGPVGQYEILLAKVDQPTVVCGEFSGVDERYYPFASLEYICLRPWVVYPLRRLGIRVSGGATRKGSTITTLHDSMFGFNCPALARRRLREGYVSTTDSRLSRVRLGTR